MDGTNSEDGYGTNSEDGYRTNNKGGVVPQGKEAESQSMEDVDHPGHSGILAKGH